MVRSLIWEEVDPSRSGVVPGTFDRDMSFDRYIEWLMGTQPIAMTDAMGTTTSSGKKTVREVLSERVLSGSEALRLFDTVYPSVRLGKDMELLQADSLRPGWPRDTPPSSRASSPIRSHVTTSGRASSHLLTRTWNSRHTNSG